MKPLIIANWKMNLTLKSARELAFWIDQHAPKNFIIAPPSIYISELSRDMSNIKVAAQDLSTQDAYGSFTGEISASMLKSSGVSYAITGHSERRQGFGDSSRIVAKKTQNCFNNDITPIICVGEDAEIREIGRHKEYVVQQILNSIPKSKKDIIIAYEPIWSIGTGIVAEIEEIRAMMKYIKSNINICSVAKNIQLVYGGSVNSYNFEKIVAIEDVDGVLIGNASLKQQELKIIFDKLNK